jgi:exosortase/archaeosortase family protein
LLALLAVGLLWTRCGPRAAVLPRVGLLLLAAPIVPSLQFYLGYPLRVVVGVLAAGWLRMGGLAVSPRGAGLAWDGQVVLVDAPCSGVAMLWGTLFVALAAALLDGLSRLRTVALLAAALVLAVASNSLRSAGLFYREAGLVESPAWTHDAAGLCVFAATGVAIALLARRLGGERCET